MGGIRERCRHDAHSGWLPIHGGAQALILVMNGSARAKSRLHKATVRLTPQVSGCYPAIRGDSRIDFIA
jgi:hypothetical protein